MAARSALATSFLIANVAAAIALAAMVSSNLSLRLFATLQTTPPSLPGCLMAAFISAATAGAAHAALLSAFESLPNLTPPLRAAQCPSYLLAAVPLVLFGPQLPPLVRSLGPPLLVGLSCGALCACTPPPHVFAIAAGISAALYATPPFPLSFLALDLLVLLLFPRPPLSYFVVFRFYLWGLADVAAGGGFLSIFKTPIFYSSVALAAAALTRAVPKVRSDFKLLNLDFLAAARTRAFAAASVVLQLAILKAGFRLPLGCAIFSTLCAAALVRKFIPPPLFLVLFDVILLWQAKQTPPPSGASFHAVVVSLAIPPLALLAAVRRRLLRPTADSYLIFLVYLFVCVLVPLVAAGFLFVACADPTHGCGGAYANATTRTHVCVGKDGAGRWLKIERAGLRTSPPAPDERVGICGAEGGWGVGVVEAALLLRLANFDARGTVEDLSREIFGEGVWRVEDFFFFFCADQRVVEFRHVGGGVVFALPGSSVRCFPKMRSLFDLLSESLALEAISNFIPVHLLFFTPPTTQLFVRFASLLDSNRDEGVAMEVCDKIFRRGGGGDRVAVIGHGAGAALAQLCAAKLGGGIGFGGPGLRSAAHKFGFGDERVFEFLNLRLWDDPLALGQEDMGVSVRFGLGGGGGFGRNSLSRITDEIFKLCKGGRIRLALTESCE